MTGTAGETVLITEDRASGEAVDSEDPHQLADWLRTPSRCLTIDPLFDPRRADYLAAQVRALRAVARRLDGEELPLREYARQCLGIKAEWLPESLFEAAHVQPDAALPKTAGSLAERMQARQATHALPRAQMVRLPGLVDTAVAETRARINAIVPLPADEVVDCQLLPGAHFLAAGHHHGGLRSTIFVNSDLPFNLADMLYVVPHEGHPGHIAESLLKEIYLVNEQGRLEQQVRFMISPSFVISEGLGLHAEALILPDDQAQAWLTDNTLTQQGIRPDGSDFAAIHQAKNVLWGAWGNTAFLTADGRPDADIAGYLSRWALLSDTEIGPALHSLKAPGRDLYILGYYHGWRILRSWLNAPTDTTTYAACSPKQLLPTDLQPRDPR